MKDLPRFVLSQESSGNVTIFFRDVLSAQAHERFAAEMQRLVPHIPKKDRDVWGLEKTINSIFFAAQLNKKLKKINKVWVWGSK